MSTAAAAVAESPAPVAAPRWSVGHRLGFRFVFCWAALTLMPFPLDSLPFIAEWIQAKWSWLPGKIVPWVGHKILHIQREIPSEMTGSGDRTYDWVSLACVVGVALVATAVWSMADRARPSYPRLGQWLRTYIRLSLATAMLGYGLSKVFVNQFPSLIPQQFLQPFGSMTPMGLLWRFMQFSPGYTIFTGTVETVAGVMLFVPRLRTAGALVAAGALANVMALNFFYDVPVKLYSTQLLLMSLWVAGPDLRRLADVLVRNHATTPAPAGWRASSKRLRTALVVLEAVFFVALIFEATRQNLKQKHEMAEFLRPKPPSGLYNVKANGPDDAFAMAHDWCKLAIIGDRMQIITHDEKLHAFGVAIDDKAHTWTFTHDDADGKDQKLTLAVRDEANGARVLTADKLTLTLTLAPMEKTKLMSRGFHWINEYPNNR
jgi:uncharacterized membrane protein YphA (DoxX/SURF4 family)